MRECSRCHAVRPDTDYPPRSNGSPNRWCLDCRKDYFREYGRAHREQAAANQRAYRKRNPERSRENDRASFERRRGLITKTPLPKACKKCGIVKPPEEFLSSDRTRTGLRSWCKKCHVDTAVEWNKTHPERFRYNQRNYVLRSQYGLSRADYDAMLASQGGGCAICGARSGGKQGWHVDHCHKTGVVRGILCFRCNTSIGRFGDDPALIRRAARYLTKKRQDIEADLPTLF